MAIQLKSTNNRKQTFLNILVYGQAGAGKSYSLGTLPSPVILSAEGGLLCLSDLAIPYIEIASMADLKDAFEWLASDEAKQFSSVGIDSISEIAEVVLNYEKKNTKDPRQAYGALQEQMTDIIRAFRDLPEKHVVMTAKVEKMQDEMGRILYGPSMPGNKLGQMLPYFFDEVFALRVERNAEGETMRAFMTDTDGSWIAKDRSGKLAPWFEPDFSSVMQTILNLGE